MGLEVPYFDQVIVDGVKTTGTLARINIPEGMPFLKVWAFYQCDRTSLTLTFESSLRFYGRGNQEVLSLPAQRRLNGVTQYGFVQSIGTATNTALTSATPGVTAAAPRMIPPFAYHFNTAQNDNQSWITPFDIEVGCQRLEFESDYPTVIGGIDVHTYLILAVLASVRKI
jgi:hypothetical protein